ncbi:hypothetical protein ACFO9Q_16545 [Paenibacillus sp. GCM10023252]|uniref:hypothetical protein n=1 Tax=Paenibacillus sp. GCM10023252 TaxID=3252649 RepID=UPI0036071017
MADSPELSIPDPTRGQINRILDPNHPLCKEDVLWMLQYIKKKVADEDPSLLDLSQPRLLRNFHFFAEASMSLIQRSHCADYEAERLRTWLAEASYGL